MNEHTTSNRAPHRLTSGLVVSFVALVGVDRVDFFSGAGAFTLTPAVLMAPLLVTAALFLAVQVPSPTPIGARMRTGSTLLYALFLGLLLGAFVSESDKTPARLVQLALIAAAGWATVSIVRRLDAFRLLKYGALAGLILIVLFDAVQWLTFQTYGLRPPAFSGVLNLMVTPYGEGVVRLAGGSTDANRAALTVALYVHLLVGDPLSGSRRRASVDVLVMALGTALVLATISRSGLVAFAIAMIGAAGHVLRRFTPNQRVVSVVALGVGVATLFASGFIDRLGVADIADSRLDVSEGSARTHFALLSHGIRDFSDAGAWSFLFGRGYGSSYVYLQDIFPGNDYGNYHSLWITMLVEGGVVVFAAMIVLLTVPILGPRRWVAIGAIFFGVFYQSHTDPTFWLLVAVLWGLPSKAIDAPQDPVPTARSSTSRREEDGQWRPRLSTT